MDIEKLIVILEKHIADKRKLKTDYDKAIKGLKLAVAILTDVEMASSFVTSNLESDECPSDLAQFSNLWYELGSGESRKEVQKYLEDLGELL